jgi:hypothetical protein
VSRLDQAKTGAEIIKLAIDAWALIDERRKAKKAQEQRIKELEAEVERLKGSK